MPQQRTDAPIFYDRDTSTEAYADVDYGAVVVMLPSVVHLNPETARALANTLLASADFLDGRPTAAAPAQPAAGHPASG